MFLESNLPNVVRQKRPILQREIEEVQRVAQSAGEAARLLGVNYATYKKYAKLYNLFDNLKNPSGKGIRKGYSDKRNQKGAALEDILVGKHPSYPVHKLKKRLIDSHTVEESCALCGFSERRAFDNRVPLMLIHKDGNRANHLRDNIHLLCFNCVFLTFSHKTSIGILHKDILLDTSRDDGVPASEFPLITWSEDDKQQVLRDIGNIE